MQLLLQRVRYAAISVRTRQGMTDFLVGQGALPGDALAAHLFRLTYDKAISRWVVHNSGLERGKELNATDPISGIDVDLSMSIYADDVRRVTVASDPWTLPGQLKAQDSALTAELNALGIAQSSSKKEHVITPFWPCHVEVSRGT